jgi:predicted membrane-bound mannosyltransferase
VHSLTAYWHYIARSDEGVHQHAWPYYLRILLFAKYGPGPWWSEGVIVVLSVIGAIAGIRSRRGAQRDFVFFLAVYTFCMTLIYTLIPYKTPWCLLSFLHGMILLAGVGAVAIFTFLPGRILKVMAAVLLLLAAAHLGAQAYRASYVYDTDVRNPYVYSHSVRDVVRLAERVDQMAALHPKGRRMLVQVIASNADYWPLPWYLRDYANVGYWNEVPEGPLKAPMVVCSVDLEETVLQRLEGEYQSEYFGLRPHSLLAVFIHKDLWDQFIDKQMQKVGT